ncbi:MAG: hypothetical protein IPH24_18295 [Crocinitomicaceae bacterium]|nr:hypothetical protein [Crocinitomicaceae bacterium]
MVWKQEFNRKGDLVKTKRVYEQDSILVLIESFDAEERLRSQNTFLKMAANYTSHSIKKGKYNTPLKAFTISTNNWQKSQLRLADIFQIPGTPMRAI